MKNLMYMQISNFGDALNEFIYYSIAKKECNHVDLGSHQKSYMAIGSILNHATKNTIVWGAGLAQPLGDVKLNCDIRAVRGPITREMVLENGHDCPDVYGDPALLLPNYFYPKVEKKYKLGILPHVVDYENIINFDEDILKIDLNEPYHKVVENLLSCEKTISSSLHGLIVSDAYGIPTKWVEFSDKVLGNGLKFHDYYKSIGISDEKPLNLRNCDTSVADLSKKIKKYNVKIDLDALLDACPFKK